MRNGWSVFHFYGGNILIREIYAHYNEICKCTHCRFQTEMQIYSLSIRTAMNLKKIICGFYQEIMKGLSANLLYECILLGDTCIKPHKLVAMRSHFRINSTCTCGILSYNIRLRRKIIGSWIGYIETGTNISHLLLFNEL